MDIVIKGQSVSDSFTLKPFLDRRWELTVQSGCLLWGRRVIIPQSLRTKMLEQLHAGHSGIVKMKEMARSYFWWPGLDKQIEHMAMTCSSCHKTRNNPPAAPLHPWDFPQDPWYRIHIDFAGPFEDKMFLVAVDAHSKWPEVAIMKTTTSEKTIEELGEIFSRFGAPVQLVSDNGPQLVSKEMSDFLQANGVQHIRSAPYHPATNGLAERFVQTLKHALKISQGQSTLHQRLHEFLLQYRTTPHSTTKVSPASLMFNRELRTNLDLLKPPTVKDIVQANQRKQIKQRDIHAKNRVLAPGDSVLARNYQGKVKWIPATVIAQTGPVSYTVQTTDGVWRRHVDQLLKTPETTPKLSVTMDFDKNTDNSVPELCNAPLPMFTPVRPTVVSSDQPGNASVPEPSPIVDKADVTFERRYPTRERKAPIRLNL
uniref:Gypsy retrotransposon integrase-like protein 1 n=2 Tax=Neogobius melanostomus TaxID=47308 RepID=A0A8C6U8I0_9GOBI